jgi:hypothetical protein
LQERFGLTGEHNGNIIPDFIEQFAGFADKTIFFFIEFDFSLAFRAGKNVKEFLFYHELSPVIGVGDILHRIIDLTSRHGAHAVCINN